VGRALLQNGPAGRIQRDWMGSQADRVVGRIDVVAAAARTSPAGG
jgi:hypothetical protein